MIPTFAFWATPPVPPTPPPAEAFWPPDSGTAPFGEVFDGLTEAVDKLAPVTDPAASLVTVPPLPALPAEVAAAEVAAAEGDLALPAAAPPAAKGCAGGGVIPLPPPVSLPDCPLPEDQPPAPAAAPASPGPEVDAAPVPQTKAALPPWDLAVVTAVAAPAPPRLRAPGSSETALLLRAAEAALVLHGPTKDIPAVDLPSPNLPSQGLPTPAQPSPPQSSSPQPNSLQLNPAQPNALQPSPPQPSPPQPTPPQPDPPEPDPPQPNPPLPSLDMTASDPADLAGNGRQDGSDDAPAVQIAAQTDAPRASGPSAAAVPLAHVPRATIPALLHAVKDTGGDTVDLVMNPEELGRLRFEITQAGDQTRIVLSVERPETLDLLRRHAEQLLTEFRQAGYGTATLSFGQWGQGSDRGSPPPAFAPPPGHDSPPAGATPTPTPTPSLAAPTGGLDLRL